MRSVAYATEPLRTEEATPPLEKFQKDLLESVQQMRLGEAARVTDVELPAAAEARARVGLSQQELANLLGVNKGA